MRLVRTGPLPALPVFTVLNFIMLFEHSMLYRCEAQTVPGFIQQLAVSYIGHGYWFYVAGNIPDDKDPPMVDAKLISKYGINLSRAARSRRKAAGLANIQYIRFRHFFV